MPGDKDDFKDKNENKEDTVPPKADPFAHLKLEGESLGYTALNLSRIYKRENERRELL